VHCRTWLGAEQESIQGELRQTKLKEQPLLQLTEAVQPAEAGTAEAIASSEKSTPARQRFLTLIGFPPK